MSTCMQLHGEWVEMEAARQREQDDLAYIAALYGPEVTVKRYHADEVGQTYEQINATATRAGENHCRSQRDPDLRKI